MESNMTGMKYYRLTNRLSQRAVAEQIGVSTALIINMEKAYMPTCNSAAYANAAKVFGISLHSLLHGDFDPNTLTENDHARVWGKGVEGKPANCVDAYRRAENLTLQALADRMGLPGKERARLLCKSQNLHWPRYHGSLCRLAEYEDMTLEEFQETYSVS